jgi:hypothetical protein
MEREHGDQGRELDRDARRNRHQYRQHRRQLRRHPAPGASGRQSTVGSLTLDTAVLNYEMLGGVMDKTIITNQLSLTNNSTVNLTGSVSTGSFNIFTFATKIGTGTSSSARPPAASAIRSARRPQRFPHGQRARLRLGSGQRDVRPQDGDGTWVTGSNFWDESANANLGGGWVMIDQGREVRRRRGGFTVTVSGAKTAKSITFAQNYTLTGTGADTISLADGVNANSSARSRHPLRSSAPITRTTSRRRDVEHDATDQRRRT